jgi:Regulator of G protein signaling domain
MSICVSTFSKLSMPTKRGYCPRLVHPKQTSVPKFNTMDTYNASAEAQYAKNSVMENQSRLSLDLAKIDDGDSDNFVKIESKGCCSCLERVPMWLKLVFITLFAGVIICAACASLIATEIGTVGKAVNAAKFERPYITCGGYFYWLVLEHMAFTDFLVTRDLARYNMTIATTDIRAASFHPYKWILKPEVKARLEIFEANRPLVRQQFLANQNNVPFSQAQEIITFYVDYVDIIMNIITQSTSDILTENVASIVVSVLLEAYEARIMSLGTIELIYKAGDQTFYNWLRDTITKRDTYQSLFLALASAVDKEKYAKYISSQPCFNVTSVYVKQFLSSSFSYYSTLNVTDFSVFYRKLFDATDALTDDTSSTAADNLVSSVVNAVIILIIVIVLMALCTGCFGFLSLILSRSIIGPWLNLNRLQEQILYKFVPRNVVKLLGVSKIYDVTLNTSTTRTITMMEISLIGIFSSMKGMTRENKTVFMHRFYDNISPIIRQYGGVVFNGQVSSVTVIFKESIQAYKCAKQLHKHMVQLNESSSDFTHYTISIALHANKNCDMAIIGDSERFQCTILSPLEVELDQMSRIAKKFNCGLLVSNTILELINIKGTNSEFDLIGSIEDESILLYESTTYLPSVEEKKSGSELASIALNVMKREYAEATEQLTRVMKILKSKHQQRLSMKQSNSGISLASKSGANNVAICSALLIAKFYQKVLKEIMDQYKLFLNELTIQQVLAEPKLLSLFEQQCEMEMSTENISTWKIISLFKKAHANNDTQEALSISQLILNQCLQGEAININQDMRSELVTKVTNQVNDATMFDSLESEVLLLMKDTFNRFKLSPHLKKEVMKEFKSKLLEECFKVNQ